MPVRSGGDRAPLVLVHGLKGQILWARELAEELPSDLPIYALRSPLLDGHREEAGIGELAHRYLRELCRARPEGPYAIFGLSFGGFVALEMGRQLRERGAAVTVLLGDTPSPATIRNRTSLQRWRARLVRARSLGLGRGLRYIAGSARADVRTAVARRRVLRAAGIGERVPLAVRSEWVDAAHERMAREYHPEPYDGPVVLLRSEDGRRRGDHRWAELVTGPLRVVDVTGGHTEIVHAPHAAALAAAILRELNGVGTDTVARPKRAIPPSVAVPQPGGVT